MGATRDDFIKYPRTPHLFGSKGTDDDKHLGREESEAFIADSWLIVEEKLDGTNVGIHFNSRGRMVLQCRGHEITEGMHPQYDLFKQWTSVKRPVFEAMLGDRFILYGEWLYAKHSVHYRKLPHYFFEFDIYDKDTGQFLDLKSRLELLEGTGIQTVPVIHRGAVTADELRSLIRPSAFGSAFDNPLTGKTDHLMEGLYLRTEANGRVTRRAKMVRVEFVEKVKESEHWQHQKMVPNELAEGADIWA
ncbi:MAG: RNA ligase family protein [Verrucomicrobia subdivision 3 bacterium]|nr:RNA ligase family protein [Limisphaerales bacterium]